MLDLERKGLWRGILDQARAREDADVRQEGATARPNLFLALE